MTIYRWSRFVSPDFRSRNPVPYVKLAPEYRNLLQPQQRFNLYNAANVNNALLSQLQAQANINQQCRRMQGAANLSLLIGGGQGFFSGLFGGLGL